MSWLGLVASAFRNPLSQFSHLLSGYKIISVQHLTFMRLQWNFTRIHAITTDVMGYCIQWLSYAIFGA